MSERYDGPREIEAEWGHFKLSSWVEFFQQCIAQLDFYLREKLSPYPAYTAQEKAGYERVVAKGEAFAFRFMQLKASYRERGLRPPSNLALVAELEKEDEVLP